MAFSKATLISRIRGTVGDNPYVEPNSDTAAANDVTITVPDGTKWSAGDILEWQEDGDQAYVRSITGNDLTVFRSWNGTTATAHDGSVTAKQVAQNPSFKYIEVERAIEAAIQSLWPFVYKLETVTVTPDTTKNWYNGTDTLLDLSSAVQVVSGTTPANSVVFFYGVFGTSFPIVLKKNMPTAVVASGTGIYIPYFKDTTNTITVNGIARVVDTVSAGNYSDLTDGIQVECVLAYAVSNLLLSSDVGRTASDDVSMGDETVRAGVRTQLAAFWEHRGWEKREQWKMELDVTLPRMVATSRRSRKNRW